MAALLIVEDEPSTLEVLEIILAQEGYEVSAFLSAKKALASLQFDSQPLPSLIISDIVMPGMNGKEFYKELRSNSRLSMIPFLFMSAFIGVEDEQKFEEEPNTFFIRKPFDVEDLLSKIRAILK